MENQDGIEVEVLPFARMPIVDRDAQLIAYSISHQDDSSALTTATLQLFEEVAGLAMLTSNNLSFIEVNEELLRDHLPRLRFSHRVGLRVDASLLTNDRVLEQLQNLAVQDVPITIENPEWPAGLEGAERERALALIRLARCIAIDVRRHDDASLLGTVATIRSLDRDILIAATSIEEYRIHGACMEFGFDAFEGGYLFKPAPEAPLDAPRPNRTSILRLLAALQDPNNGPVELGELIRADAVLSYKLLACVNSAYFGLPRELKSLQQAAMYFGVARLRNWIYSMAIGDLDDTPPELLKQALVRARMAELLGVKLPAEQREMAFITGLFSLLDVIMGMPLERIMADIPVADVVRQALTDGTGPLAILLDKIRAWEGGGVLAAELIRSGDASLAEAYLHAVEWAEQVFSHAAGSRA